MAHGLRASFAPKPFLDQIGSGAHLHISLWRDGANLFHDQARPGGLSELGGHFVAGLLETMIVASRFSGNASANGGAIGSLFGAVSVYESVFDTNSATGYGGNTNEPQSGCGKQGIYDG